MAIQQLITQPTKISDISFEDMYAEISQDWKLKARKLQTRRWRTLKRAIKGFKGGRS